MTEITLTDLLTTRYLTDDDDTVVQRIRRKAGLTAAFEEATRRATHNAKHAYRQHVNHWAMGTVADERLDEMVKEEIRNACQNQRRYRENVGNREPATTVVKLEKI